MKRSIFNTAVRPSRFPPAVGRAVFAPAFSSLAGPALRSCATASPAPSPSRSRRASSERPADAARGESRARRGDAPGSFSSDLATLLFCYPELRGDRHFGPGHVSSVAERRPRAPRRLSRPVSPVELAFRALERGRLGPLPSSPRGPLRHLPSRGGGGLGGTRRFERRLEDDGGRDAGARGGRGGADGREGGLDRVHAREDAKSDVGRFTFHETQWKAESRDPRRHIGPR